MRSDVRLCAFLCAVSKPACGRQPAAHSPGSSAARPAMRRVTPRRLGDRLVPVHPILAKVLAEWKLSGFCWEDIRHGRSWEEMRAREFAERANLRPGPALTMAWPMPTSSQKR